VVDKPKSQKARVKIRLVASGAVLAGSLSILGAFPKVLFWNSSPSMREGLWIVQPLARVAVGAVVAACVPEASAKWARSHAVLGDGRCPGGVNAVIKRVAAVAGDRVQISHEGVTVNGKLVPGTVQNWSLDTGRVCGWRGPVPRITFNERVLRFGEVVLIGDARSRSWDSRWWGPTSGVIGVVA
jgi:conjugative transfer signal peptidase TraF